MKSKCAKRLGIALLSFLLVGSLLKLTTLRKTRSSQVIYQMSLEDRYYLAVFLRTILFSSDFSYLLFGSKPVAAEGFEKFAPFRFSRSFLSRSDFEINKGLEIFKENQHIFASKNIIVNISEDDEDVFILMINKENLRRILKEHINDFQQVLGQETTVESLFARLTGNEDLVEVVNSHQALLGILLGYGRENAWLFYQKDKLRSMSRFAPPKRQDDSIDKQYAEIEQKTDSFSEDLHEWKYILKCPRLPLPHFMADPNSLETKKLKERYEKERQEMKKLFSQENYVEITLQKLMED